ncbi:hypothetical protein WKI72_01550 [Candidatus Erwinia dacicola]
MADITLKRGRHATVAAFDGHTAITADGRVRQGGVNSDPAFRSGNMSVKR